MQKIFKKFLSGYLNDKNQYNLIKIIFELILVIFDLFFLLI